MSWKNEKVILIVLGLILLNAMCFLLGTALGVSIDHGNFTETLLPVLSVIGSWVSGIGALGAVTVALWIAEKQRRSEKEDLELNFGFVLVPGVREAVLMISAVSVGKRPSEINSVSIYGKDATAIMLVARFLNGGSQLPTNLGYGKKATFLCEEGLEIKIGEYLNRCCEGTSKDLKVCVSTTTENFVLIPDKGMKSALDSFAKKSGRAPEPIKKTG